MVSLKRKPQPRQPRRSTPVKRRADCDTKFRAEVSLGSEIRVDSLGLRVEGLY